MRAILLQMACEKAFGVGNHGKLDHIVVTMSHPDPTIAMLTAQRDVTANFPSAPFQYRQQKQAGVRQLMTSTDILGTSCYWPRRSSSQNGTLIHSLSRNTQSP
jgi:NitT/TauT family transport system substrate-binding protein